MVMRDSVMSSTITQTVAVANLNNGTIAIQQFNPTLGTLDYVELSVTASIPATGSIGVENLETGVSTVILSADYEEDISIVGQPGTLSVDLLNAGSVAILSGFDGTIDDTGPSGTTVTQFGTATGTGGGFFYAVEPLTGTGTVDLALSSPGAITDIFGGIGISASSSLPALANGTVTVTYFYTPPPPVSPPPPPVSPPPPPVSPPVSPPAPPPPVVLQSETLAPIVIAESAVGWSTTVTVPRFDPSLGTLFDARVIVNGTLDSTIDLQNTDSAAAAFASVQNYGVLSGYFNLGTAFAYITGPEISVTHAATLAPFDGAPAFTGAASVVYHDSPTDAATTTLTAADALTALTGTGSVNLDVSSFGDTFLEPANLYNATGTVVGEVDPSIRLQSAGNIGGTIDVIYDYVACFAEGTRLATEDGLVPIERLAPGRTVRTVLGGSGRVVWLGHRAVDCRRHPDPETVWPVRIAVDAFGDGLPSRALWLSPDHAVHVDGLLIPIRLLINGRSIARRPVDRVTYWHVELDHHDVVLAEDLPTESYLDTGNRSAFENGGALTTLHPMFSAQRWEVAGCAPLVLFGARVAEIRSWLDARARWLDDRALAGLGRIRRRRVGAARAG
jgi:Hint domain